MDFYVHKPYLFFPVRPIIDIQIFSKLNNLVVQILITIVDKHNVLDKTIK